MELHNRKVSIFKEHFIKSWAMTVFLKLEKCIKSPPFKEKEKSRGPSPHSDDVNIFIIMLLNYVQM